jgi:hypothetical protein
LAKIKKRKLVWKPSSSAQVVGYKLYWSEEGSVNYQSPNTKLGNVTEIVLPDDVDAFKSVQGSVELGISAVDELGNESDLVILKTPYQFNVPQAPSDVWMETLQQYHTTSDTPTTDSDQEATIHLIGNKSVQAQAPPRPGAAPSTIKPPSGIPGDQAQKV